MEVVVDQCVEVEVEQEEVAEEEEVVGKYVEKVVAVDGQYVVEEVVVVPYAVEVVVVVGQHVVALVEIGLDVMAGIVVVAQYVVGFYVGMVADKSVGLMEVVALIDFEIAMSDVGD